MAFISYFCAALLKEHYFRLWTVPLPVLFVHSGLQDRHVGMRSLVWEVCFDILKQCTLVVSHITLSHNLVHFLGTLYITWVGRARLNHPYWRSLKTFQILSLCCCPNYTWWWKSASAFSPESIAFTLVKAFVQSRRCGSQAPAGTSQQRGITRDVHSTKEQKWMVDTGPPIRQWEGWCVTLSVPWY